MTESQRIWICFVGATVASTLYLGGCITVGVVEHRGLAVYFALATAAVIYLSNMAQALFPKMLAANAVLCLGSIATGAAAGLSLVI